MAIVNPRRFPFLGLMFHADSMQDALSRLDEFIARRTPRMVFTPTAELIVRAQKDTALREVYDRADMLTIDSFVVYYTARLFGKPVTEPVSAARLMFNFLPRAQEKRYRLYMLGASRDVVTTVVDVLTARYPGIQIVGWHDGYFNVNEDTAVADDIAAKQPDVLFVAMSSPLKENFVSRNLAKMNVPVSIGVGGSFDIIAGKCALAPEWVSRIGCEWLYRLIQEPRRMWKRYLVTNTKYLMVVAKELLRATKVRDVQ